MSTAYIVDAVRTPRGRGKAGKGSLSRLHPQEILAQALNALASRAEIAKGDVDDVIVGCVSQSGEQGANIARQSVLAAGWPIEIGGVSLNRVCGSGLQAVNFAAMGAMSGVQDLVVAGGVESMSRAPMGSDGGGADGANLRLRDRFFQVPQGISADLIATIEGFSREDVDRVALRSQQRAAEAAKDPRYGRGLVPVRDPATGAVILERDETARPETTMAALARLEPAFVGVGASPAGDTGETLDAIVRRAYPEVSAIRHVHTAGNSSGLADGAAAVAIASERYVRDHGLRPRARIRSLATIGSEPVIMLTAPAAASQKALRAAGMTPRDVDLWEINEAFASVVLQTIRRLEIDPDRVNVAGGAIALGHPLGATGSILVSTAIDELERRDLSTAVITMCIGAGQGIATVLERVR